ncbi:hypothetical protein FA13DRAFT_1709958 [Coprinellus micaceus]|uniref:Restriction of telomere capping protein 4 C-terminal domain-containing protein n=1 Tax=Coprinellus micaceus TaxID=71717 RepID=A0A4Y7TAB5_COPMI|nr:hypothetical protein FA13DRAFT_1709958 [Coprinellus micaceus]
MSRGGFTQSTDAWVLVIVTKCPVPEPIPRGILNLFLICQRKEVTFNNMSARERKQEKMESSGVLFIEEEICQKIRDIASIPRLKTKFQLQKHLGDQGLKALQSSRRWRDMSIPGKVCAGYYGEMGRWVVLGTCLSFFHQPVFEWALHAKPPSSVPDLDDLRPYDFLDYAVVPHVIANFIKTDQRCSTLDEAAAIMVESSDGGHIIHALDNYQDAGLHSDLEDPIKTAVANRVIHYHRRQQRRTEKVAQVAAAQVWMCPTLPFEYYKKQEEEETEKKKKRLAPKMKPSGKKTEKNNGSKNVEQQATENIDPKSPKKPAGKKRKTQNSQAA